MDSEKTTTWIMAAQEPTDEITRGTMFHVVAFSLANSYLMNLENVILSK